MTETGEPTERVCQGDLIRDVVYCERASIAEGDVEVQRVVFPLVVVLTQDCDLEWDHHARSQDSGTQDKRLISALVAPAHVAELVFAGEHLKDLGIRGRMIDKKSTEGRFLVQNQNPRYHYLALPDDSDVGPSIVDFKHYFSAAVAYLEERKGEAFAAALPPLHREDISQRFAAFLARIALP